MPDNEYVEKLENVIKQFLNPLKNIPFNLVIESLSGKKVIPFDYNNNEDKLLLETLKNVALDAGRLINQEGIKSKRPNEVGNYIESYVKKAMIQYKLNPKLPTGASGKKRSAGYPDIIFYFKEKPYYLECKTYNLENVKSTQRTFYFSPSPDFKVIYDTHHFLLSYEMYVANGIYIYKCRRYKILSLESLSIDIKYEFNSDNKRMYSGKDGAKILCEGDVD